MLREDAVRAINELVSAEVEITKQINSRGRSTKVADARERKAVRFLFEALTGGEVATEQETLEMIGV